MWRCSVREQRVTSKLLVQLHLGCPESEDTETIKILEIFINKFE
jgi:hypothetical protein